MPSKTFAPQKADWVRPCRTQSFQATMRTLIGANAGSGTGVVHLFRRAAGRETSGLPPTRAGGQHAAEVPRRMPGPGGRDVPIRAHEIPHSFAAGGVVVANG